MTKSSHYLSVSVANYSTNIPYLNGVPQGSGPFLFFIYILQKDHITSKSQKMFAKDVNDNLGPLFYVNTVAIVVDVASFEWNINKKFWMDCNGLDFNFPHRMNFNNWLHFFI